MTDISTVKSNLHKEVEYKRHMNELRKLRENNKKSFNKENKIYQKKIKNIKTNYADNKENMENDLHRNLITLRKKHQLFLNSEQKRLGREIQLLQKTHDEKMIELTESHHTEIERKRDQHKESLKVAEAKFNREAAKYEI